MYSRFGIVFIFFPFKSNVNITPLLEDYFSGEGQRGYWARVAAGQSVPKTALPNPKNDETIQIAKRNPISEEIKVAQEQKKEKERQQVEQVGEITVPAVLELPHKLTKMTQKFYAELVSKIEKWERKKNIRPGLTDWSNMPPSADKGRYSSRASDGYSVIISLEMLDRALIFLDTLAKTLEKNGFKIQNNVQLEKNGKAVEAVKDGEGIRFHLSEGYKRRLLTPEELKAVRAERSWAPEYEMVPSTKFTFTVNGRESWTEKKWTDGSKNLEEQLPAIVAEFLDLVPRQKQLRVDRAKAAEERNERERIERLAYWKREEQKRQFESAMQESGLLQDLERLETYLNQLEVKYREAHGEMSENAIAWLKLMRAMAKSQNPLRNRLRSLKELQEIEPTDLEWMPTKQD
ncbi:hypothetical protein GALL_80520 [mine drainage metagenome]|uniref:Uncharacterized protein n=1 Tax=mine drainage metagenome TaxID=410659 RepID=A0A1J5SMF2_9ZZZZ